MTLLIDPPNSPGHGRMWSHLASDLSFAELHQFAAGVGIPERGFDRDHYDIPADRYHCVVAAGASAVSSRELIARLHAAGLRRRKGDMLGPRVPGRLLVKAPRLRTGDTVAVTAPAGPVTQARLDAGVGVLESWGLSVVATDNVHQRHEHLTYLSSDDATRAAAFMEAWNNPLSTAVFCARGGYGVQRMVDLLDWDALAAVGPKVLVGFSDVTVLHQAFASRLGLSTVHGPVVSSLGASDDRAREHLRGLLFDPSANHSLTPEPVSGLVGGRAEGVLVGGNLALLAAEIGAGFSQPATGSIAVLEDTSEDLYRVDRLLTQLLRAGWFDDVRGIALGQLTNCGSFESLQRLVKDRLGPLDVPLLWGVQVGHVEGNLAFPMGVPAVLDADVGTLVHGPGLV